MKFKNRKLYSHGQNKGVFLLQLPKVVCEDANLSSETLVDIDYIDGKIIISKVEEETKDNG